MSVQPPPGEQDERQAAPGAEADGTAAPSDLPDDGARAPDDFEDRWRRALADLANFRKRYARDLARERAAERARVARAFLPVLDTIDLALEHADADPATIIAGVRAIRDQAQATLSQLGYPRQDDVGVPFDPIRHEVVGVVSPEESGQPAGAVAAVLRPGYGASDQHLRPAAVTVADRRER